MTADSHSRSDNLDEILAQYIRAVDKGENPIRDELLTRHPDLAGELREFFADHDRMNRLAQPICEATLVPPAIAAADRIRYFGDYEVLEEIARGGMGVVFKARQVTLNRIVAIKMILSGHLASSADVERFHTEAEAAAKLDHPGIVPIYEVGQHDGQHYFSMGFVDGISLSAKVAQGPLPAREAAELVRTVAEAVQYAHDKGVIHRDLKPGNILLDGQGRPRVTDFGLAKLTESVSDLTGTGQILGTPGYMPPEQAAGQVNAVGRLSDVYSLGAILYCLLTGRPPFQAATPLETLLQVQNQEPVPPRQLNLAIPLDLDTIVLKCLDKSPSRRYLSARELEEDLGRFVRGEPTIARPPKPWERGIKWTRRHPTHAGFALASSVALLAIVGVAVGQRYNARLKTANEDLISAKATLENTNSQLNTTNEQLQTAKETLEKSNGTIAATAEKLESAVGDLKTEQAKSRRYLYAARMALIQRAEQANQPSRVVQLLRSVIPATPEQEDLRDFEWHHLWRKYNGEESRLLGHTAPVTAVAFSPDDKWLASGSEDCTVKLWDAGSGKEHHTLVGHRAGVTVVAFSPDSRFLVSASADTSLKIWDCISGQEIQSFVGHVAPVTAVAFSPDGQHIASGSEDGVVYFWNSSAAEKLAASDVSKADGTSGKVTGLYFDSDRSVLMASSNGYVKHWQPFEDRIAATFDAPRASTNHAFSPHGNRVLSARGSARSNNTTLMLWDHMTNRDTIVPVVFPGVATHVAFSLDGTMVAAAATDETVRVWDASSGIEVCKLHAQDGVLAVAFSPTSTRVAAGTDDRSVMLWSVPGKEVRTVWQGGDVASCVAFGAKGRLLGGVCGKEALVWEVPAGRLVSRSSAKGYRRIALSATKSWIAGAANNLADATTGNNLHTYQLPGADKGLTTYVISDDESLIGAASGAGSATVWDANSGNLIQSFTLREWATAVSFSPDSRLLAAGGGNDSAYPDTTEKRGSVQVWDIATGQTVLPMQLFVSQVWALAFSPDGKLLAAAMGDFRGTGGYQATVRVWNTSNWQVVNNLRGHSGCVWSVAFSPAGNRLASAGGGRNSRSFGEAKIWDVYTGEEVATILNPKGTFYGVAFSPNGRHLATASSDGVKLFDGTPVAETPTYQVLPDE